MDRESQAREEIRAELEAVARRGKTIYYSQLTPRVKAVHLERDSNDLASLLDDVSRESDARMGVMLSAVVVRKGEDHVPGSGFFKLARELGRQVGNDPMAELEFHTMELKAVHKAFAG
ncbi:MAG: hypothetical protein ACTHNP_06200 [Solirubrobacterales bacterium]